MHFNHYNNSHKKYSHSYLKMKDVSSVNEFLEQKQSKTLL